MSFNIIFGTVLCILISTTMATDPKVIVKGNEKFGKNLFSHLAETDGNFISSPFSAHVVLTMAYQGAVGDTANAFKSVLGIESPEAAAKEYQTLLSDISKINTVTFKTANKIFLKNAFSLKKEFRSVVEQKFASEAEELNFVENMAAADTINHWVETKTNNKIKQLISPDMLDENTRLVMVNAVYFKGNWANKFLTSNTKQEPFYLSDGSEIKCNMMHINGKYNYGEDDTLKAQIIEMPYEGKELSMLIMLPNERDGIRHLESQLSKFNFANFNQQLYNTEVNLALPRFKIESSIPMKDILTEMGLGVIFSDAANFSKIAESGEPLKVSNVIQKAFLEVNEEGAEAAAATGIVMVAFSAMIPQMPKNVQADHPFIVALVDKKAANNVLFLGRLTRP